MSEDLDFLDDIGEEWADDSLKNQENTPVESQPIEKSIDSISEPVSNSSDPLKSGDEFVAVSEETKSENIETIDSTDSLAVMGIKRDDFPKLIGDDFPQPYTAIADGIIIQYSRLPHLEYGDIYAELADLSIKSCPAPTLQVINDEIQKVQAAKDRLGEIYCEVLQNYHFKKRAVDILEAAWSKYTLEKNADKRKGDAIVRTSEFSTDYARVESLAKVCQHILKNLDSLHESLSRRITINQLLLKLNDMGRGSLPISDFNTRPLADLLGDAMGVSKKDPLGESDETSEDNEANSNDNEVDEMTF